MTTSQRLRWLGATAVVVALLFLLDPGAASRPHPRREVNAQPSPNLATREEPAALSSISPEKTEKIDDEAPVEGRRLRLTVLDRRANAPIPAARVVLVTRQGSRIESLTDGDGVFDTRLREGFSESPTLCVCAPGFQSLREPLDLATSLNVEVLLAPLTTLVVRCEDTDGSGVENTDGLVAVLVPPFWAATTRIYGRDEPRLFTADPLPLGADGVVRFDGVPAGTGYRLRVGGSPLFVDSELSGVEIPFVEEHEIVVVLRLGGSIRGRIRDCEGREGSEFEIVCKSVRTRGGKNRVIRIEKSTSAEPDGYFELDGIEPGEKLLRFHRQIGSRHERFSRALRLSPGEHVDLGHLGPPSMSENGASLSAQVLAPDGAPAVGTRVSIRVDDATTWQRSVAIDATTDEHGRTSACGLPPGKTAVFVSMHIDDRVVHAETEIVMEAGKSHHVELLLAETVYEPRPGGYIEVKVHGEDGTPLDLSGSRVRAFLRERTREEWTNTNLDTLPADDGTVSVLRLSRPAPGHYDLLVIDTGRLAWLRGLEVLDEETWRGSVVLEPGSDVYGAVLDKETGRAIEGAEVKRVFELHDSPLQRAYGEVVTGPKGEFVIRTFLPDELGRVEVEAEGYRSVIVDVVGGRGDVLVFLDSSK